MSDHPALVSAAELNGDRDLYRRQSAALDYARRFMLTQACIEVEPGVVRMIVREYLHAMRGRPGRTA